MNKCIFIGSKKFGLVCLKEIYKLTPNALQAVITFDDRLDCRSEYNRIVDFTQNKAPLYVTNCTNELKSLLLNYKPNLVFVCGWYKIIPEELLSIPALGFAGFHFSLLPKYRGGAPVVWAMINGESESGFTLFKLSAGMDNGPIYDQKKISIAPSDYINDVLSKIENSALLSFQNHWKNILSGKAQHQEQTMTTQPSYGAQRGPQDGKINWTQAQHEIFNFIKAQSRPYAGAFTTFNGKKMTIWKAQPTPEIYNCTPGQVVAINDGMIFVGCGDNKVMQIQEVCLDGGEPISPDKCVKSINVRF